MKRKNAGVTTIVVVCVMAMITALSLSLFLTASVMLQNSARSLAADQCRILANSFRGEIQKELTDPSKTFYDRQSEDEDRTSDHTGTSLWHYVKWELTDGTWPYLDEAGSEIHHRENAIRTFQMGSDIISGQVADTYLSLYWVPEKEDIVLTVETKVTVKGQTCIVADHYRMQKTEMNHYDGFVWKYEG